MTFTWIVPTTYHMNISVIIWLKSWPCPSHLRLEFLWNSSSKPRPNWDKELTLFSPSHRRNKNKNINKRYYFVITSIRIAPKRMHTLIWTSWLFINIKNKNFGKIWIWIFHPTPLGWGVLKKWNFQKLVAEHNLQNMIFESHKMRTKSKRWALHLKNLASYANFHVSTKEKIVDLQIFISQYHIQFLRF